MFKFELFSCRAVKQERAKTDQFVRGAEAKTPERNRPTKTDSIFVASASGSWNTMYANIVKTKMIRLPAISESGA